MAEKLSDSAAPPWGDADAVAGPLRAWLRRPPPAAAGSRGDAFFIHGAVVHEGGVIERLDVDVDGRGRRAMAAAMPTPGLGAELDEPTAARAGFWSVAPLVPGEPGDEVEVRLRGALAGGSPFELGLGLVRRVLPEPVAGASSPVVICMATHEPPAELFERQLESIVGQTQGDWICVISDDASSDAAFDRIERATAEDGRFVVARSEQRLGAYANFGRALELAPADASYVALADQDDVWHPDKLARLVDTLDTGDARLAFSDMRLVRPDGAVISDTYWTKRVPNHQNFASLLLGNSVTGAASAFRRNLLDDALPLPPHFGNLYHDHWLALIAAATGTIDYVDRPLYDYVQHPAAVIGHAGANRGVVGGSLARRLAALRGRPPGRLRDEWRRIYFGEYCRMALSAVALSQRLGHRLSDSHRRAIDLALAADRSATGLAWLAGRQVRRIRRDDTGGSEAGMLRGLAWRRALARRSGADELDDADLPVEFL